MMILLTQVQGIRDNPGFFQWISEQFGASCDRIEQEIGRGNLKWVICVLLLILALWYARRQRSTSF